MKRTVCVALYLWLIAAVLICSFTLVDAGIRGSKHDFSGSNWANGQICLPCHAPHTGSKVANIPLWNHEISTATYTLYSSPTLDAVPGQPAGISKLCLSCHDGTVAIDSFGGHKGSQSGSHSGHKTGGRIGTEFITGSKLSGTDLSDDHPISFIYDTALAQADGGLYDPTVQLSGVPGNSGTISQDMLFSGSIECASCHDVHNTNNQGKLMVKCNQGSRLCLTCHNK